MKGFKLLLRWGSAVREGFCLLTPWYRLQSLISAAGRSEGWEGWRDIRKELIRARSGKVCVMKDGLVV